MTAPRKIPLSMVFLLVAFIALLIAVFPKVGQFFGLLEKKHDLVGGIADFSQIILVLIMAFSGLYGAWLRYSERHTTQWAA